MAKGLPWCLSAVLLAGFSSQGYAQESHGGEKVVVASTTQIADFARQIVGDRWIVECILSPGADPHTYQPTPDDVEKVK